MKLPYILLCLLLSAAPALAQSPELANKYYYQALDLKKAGNYLEAARMFEKSAEAERTSPNPRPVSLLQELFDAGNVYHYIDQYDKAITLLNESLQIARRLKEEMRASAILNSIGMVYDSKGSYDKALKCYEEALSISRKYGSHENMIIHLTNIAQLYDSLGDYSKTLLYAEEALPLSRKLGHSDNVIFTLNTLGSANLALGQYDKAIRFYEEAKHLAKETGNDSRYATSLGNIGGYFDDIGKYDKAIKSYEEALTINRRLGRESQVASLLSNIGGVYRSWGQFDKAIKHYEEALAMNRRLGRMSSIAISLNNLGVVYNKTDNPSKAIGYFNESLEIKRRSGDIPGIVRTLNNIGEAYRNLNKPDKAIECYQEGFAIAQKNGMDDLLSSILNNIGLIHDGSGNFSKAIESYRSALQIDRKLGREPDIAIELTNIGAALYGLKQYDQSITHFKDAIDILERLRTTAKGDARRDYLASQMTAYRWLILLYIETKNYAGAYAAIELSKAKSLAEQLASSELPVAVPPLDQVQKSIPEDTALLMYANAGSGLELIGLAITRTAITGARVSSAGLLDGVQKKYAAPLQNLLRNQRGLKIAEKPDKTVTPKTSTPVAVEDVIAYYRSLITSPSETSRGLTVTDKRTPVQTTGSLPEISRMLHEYLVQPLKAALTEKQRLVIIPDGVLGYLPFEALVDGQGRFLVETYAIQYSQSVNVLEMLRKRNHPVSRKDLLAFGGAVYDELTYAGDMVTSGRELQALAKSLKESDGKRSLRDLYASLDKAKWDNLPGTLTEVRAIAGIVPQAKIYTGKDVTKKTVKELSRNGELAQYKTIHFATHGLVVPELPELSAIVLSQFRNEQSGDDGYLRMNEIAALNMKADFVNLSACETGLGKIYGGEGVVGLTQSFLLAGANALSASLWSVNDASTSKFMVAFYELVEKNKTGYAAAINEIKRGFIQGKFGEEYKSPYYWAPFVYYGKM